MASSTLRRGGINWTRSSCVKGGHAAKRVPKGFMRTDNDPLNPDPFGVRRDLDATHAVLLPGCKLPKGWRVDQELTEGLKKVGALRPNVLILRRHE